MNDSTVECQVQARCAAIDERIARGERPYETSIVVPCHPGAVLQEDISSLPDMQQLQDGVHASDQPHQVMGRLLQVNDIGRLAFAFIRSDGIELQLCATAQQPAALAALKAAALGDHVWAVGYAFRTRQGKRALLVTEARVVTPCVRPLPSKALLCDSAGADVRWRAENASADMVLRPETLATLRRRAAIVSAVRATLDQRGFIEVETRSLMRTASGATAEPFVAHHRASGEDVRLRIATEIELKRLVVGGLERVYELGRVYRNEGADRTHCPEFTTVELYHAGIDTPCMMMLVEDIIREAAYAAGCGPELAGTLSAPIAYERITMRDAVLRFAELSHVPIQRAMSVVTWTEAVELSQYAHEQCGMPAGVSYGQALQGIFDRFVVPKLLRPTFVLRHPLELSPLSAACPGDPMLADRFELYASGMEIANGCAELTDPREQHRRMVRQGTVDEDLIRALELGLPPTAGCGIGIDRLCMLLLGADRIADVMALPR